jgi:hypothetical protein
MIVNNGFHEKFHFYKNDRMNDYKNDVIFLIFVTI